MRRFPGCGSRGESYFPPDISAGFYHRTNGAELYREDNACRIVPASDIEPLDWGEMPEEFGNSRGPDGRIWHRFAWLAGW